MVVQLQSPAEADVDSPSARSQAIPLLPPISRKTSSETAEIDAREVFEHLRRAQPAGGVSNADEPVDFNPECAVDWVAPEERGIIPVDACPACGNEWARARFAIAGVRFRLVDCVECGVGRLHPRPDARTLRRFYPPNYYGVTGSKFVPTVEALVRFVAARHVRSLSHGLPAGARVLDVGCGRGVLLASLADRGFEVHGFEISETAAAGADPRAAIRIGNSLEEAGYPDAHFDQVILWHVLEHLPDPGATLEEIRRILKPGGRLVVAVPNYSSLQARVSGPSWFHLDLPRHLFHFPVEGLRRMLDQRGFSRRSEHHFSLRQNPFGWVQSALNRLRSLPRNGLYTSMKSRREERPVCGRATRWAFNLAYWLGMPIGCVLSVAEALARRGATVCIVAEAAAGRPDRVD